MKNKLLKIVAVLALIAGMTGIVAADPCPANPKTDTFNGAWVITESSPSNLGTGEKITYKLGTNIIPGVTVKEFCVYNDTFTKNPAYPVLTPLWNPSDLWDVQNKDGQFLFKGASHPYIPINGLITPVGIADYKDNNQPMVKYNIHIVDSTLTRTYCPPNREDPDTIVGTDNNTCFRDPNGSPPPPGIPEFPSIALPVSAVIGLLFFFNQRKNKKE